MRKSVNVAVGVLFCCLLLSSTAIASFNKDLWPKWQVHDPLSEATIPHQAWQHILSHYLFTNSEGINLIDYSNLSKNDSELLAQYLHHMSQIPISQYNRQEQLAFWLNVYNALTVQTVANYYPVSSIQDINISPGLFSIGPWGANLITIDGCELSLEDIHNRIIRPIWNDPRTHYAINNASIGSPNLRKQAYQGKYIEQQLNAAATEYINSLRGIQIIEGKLIASKLYDWFFEDFGGTEKSLILHLCQFANKPLRRVLQKIHEINTYTYNWHLNTTLNSGSQELKRTPPVKKKRAVIFPLV